YLTGQPGLARPTRPSDRHQPVLPKQARDLAHRTVPADEARQHGRETMKATSCGDCRRPPHARTISPGPPPRTAPASQAIPDGQPLAGHTRRSLPVQPGRPPSWLVGTASTPERTLWAGAALRTVARRPSEPQS